MTSSQTEITLPEKLTPLWISKNHNSLKKLISHDNLLLKCSNLTELNIFGVAFITELHLQSLHSKTTLYLSRLPDFLKEKFQNVPSQAHLSSEIPKNNSQSIFDRLGDTAILLLQNVSSVLYLLTEAIYWSSFGLFKKKSILKGSTIEQMIQLGSSAIFIVLLLSFLIGLTLAIQSAVQLEQFGASIYLASGIGISMVTEIGPMMTAVILAGRSGSAITAEISTMVVQEELKALKSMAINPIHFILLPRIWAMTVTLPLLTVCSALIGIFAGFLVSFFYLDIPTDLFINELAGAVTITMVWQSFVKVITFAWLISLVSIFKGFRVGGGGRCRG